MFSLRNGTLPANALLVVIGAAAGAGVTVLVSPVLGKRNEPRSLAAHENPTARSGGSFSSGKTPTVSEALRIEDAIRRAASLREAGAGAASKDPKSALESADKLQSDQDKLEFLRGIYSEWSVNDPESALEHAKTSMTTGQARSEVIGIAVNKWAARDPRAAWMWTEENLSGPLKEQAFNDVLVGWTRRSPQAAADWLSATGMNSQSLVGSVARTWAEQDPKAALAWAKAIPDKETRQSAYIPVVSQWLVQKPAEAAAEFTDEASQPDGAPIAITIADIWGTTDPAATSEWIASLPEGASKLQAAATLATVWAASDINAAVSWATGLTDWSVGKQVITHIGTSWGAIEPDAALTWLNTLPPAIAADGIIGAFNSWAATDAQRLRDWVDSNPPSASLDVARMALAEVYSDTDVQSSMDLAFQLSSATNRDNAIARYYRHWAKTDEAGASAWLTQNWSALDVSTRQRLTMENQRRVVRK
jgi:hypothetical protein